MILAYNLSLAHLREALYHEQSEFTRDATIRRFVMCFSGAGFAIRAVAYHRHGVDLGLKYARIFDYAFQKKWIADKQIWGHLAELHQLELFGLDNATAQELYNIIFVNAGHMVDLLRNLEGGRPRVVETACVRQYGKNFGVEWFPGTKEVFLNVIPYQYVGVAESVHRAMELAGLWLLTNGEALDAEQE
jgi:hypothetical protein